MLPWRPVHDIEIHTNTWDIHSAWANWILLVARAHFVCASGTTTRLSVAAARLPNV
ncbi:MAG TPA: hypothetical protein VH762_00705 [Gemmatimonadaceae bacterium]